eukprot:GHVH01003647.1.p1 GENE.GHVH01003647.1~~GHVH01003647.1.p1  ORF type:complete len:148 (+),score=6.24 GHVH01003647.1:130-573(+)
MSLLLYYTIFCELVYAAPMKKGSVHQRTGGGAPRVMPVLGQRPEGIYFNKGRRNSFTARFTRALMSALDNYIFRWITISALLFLFVYLGYYVVVTGGISPDNRKRHKAAARRKELYDSISDTSDGSSPFSASSHSPFFGRRQREKLL